MPAALWSLRIAEDWAIPCSCACLLPDRLSIRDDSRLLTQTREATWLARGPLLRTLSRAGAGLGAQQRLGAVRRLRQGCAQHP